MSKTLRLALASGLLACALGVSTSSARADLPMPEGFVETCTLERATGPGQECVLCGDSYYKTPDACAAKLGPKGFAKSCRSKGGSTWKEVWCKKGKGTPPAPSAAEPAPAPAPAPSASAAEPATPVASSEPAASASPPSPPPAADDANKPLPENAPKRGCSACAVGAPDGETGVLGFGVALGLLGLGWARRQRHA
jgi:MYXO-CTERM domain-containing protein